MNWTSVSKKWAWIGVVLGFLVLLFPGLTPAFAHGEEEVTVEPNQAKHGDTIMVTGKEFTPNVDLTIALEGVRGVVPLGRARTDDAGAFTVHLKLPEEAFPGFYQLKVLGGEEEVSVEFSVLVGESSAEPGGTRESQLVFERSGGETIAIVVIVLALIVAGVVLVLAGTDRGLRVLRKRQSGEGEC